MNENLKMNVLKRLYISQSRLRLSYKVNLMKFYFVKGPPKRDERDDQCKDTCSNVQEVCDPLPSCGMWGSSKQCDQIKIAKSL